jgi:hypothetical protein
LFVGEGVAAPDAEEGAAVGVAREQALEILEVVEHVVLGLALLAVPRSTGKKRI